MLQEITMYRKAEKTRKPLQGGATEQGAGGMQQFVPPNRD